MPCAHGRHKRTGPPFPHAVSSGPPSRGGQLTKEGLAGACAYGYAEMRCDILGHRREAARMKRIMMAAVLPLTAALAAMAQAPPKQKSAETSKPQVPAALT